MSDVSPPDWPRLLTREQAAAYVGVSVDVFDDEVRAGDWPPPRRRGARGGRLTWDRKLLDLAEDRRSGLAAVAPSGGAMADRPWVPTEFPPDDGAVDRTSDQEVRRWKERIGATTPPLGPQRLARPAR